jgi:TPP-dependent pyruvate/acetoin dehydrogenase alpha subunit
MTNDTDSFFGEMYGKETGCAKGKAGSMHMSAPEKNFIATSAVVGTTIPVAVGSGMAAQYRKSNEISAVFFGDGSVEEGVFWESLNFASLKKLNVLFICEDNELAIHTHKRERQGFKTLLKVADAFHCHIGEGQGSDLTSVVQTARQVVAQMAADPKPGFIYLPYFRFLEHVGPKDDFGAGYRSKPEVEAFKAHDPILKFEKEILQNDLASPQELDQIKQSLKTQINASVAKAQKAPFAAPEELFNDVLI